MASAQDHPPPAPENVDNDHVTNLQYEAVTVVTVTEVQSQEGDSLQDKNGKRERPVAGIDNQLQPGDNAGAVKDCPAVARAEALALDAAEAHCVAEKAAEVAEEKFAAAVVAAVEANEEVQERAAKVQKISEFGVDATPKVSEGALQDEALKNLANPAQDAGHPNGVTIPAVDQNAASPLKTNPKSQHKQEHGAAPMQRQCDLILEGICNYKPSSTTPWPLGHAYCQTPCQSCHIYYLHL